MQHDRTISMPGTPRALAGRDETVIYAFGDFELDEERWELREAGEPVAATPKVLETLFYLIRHRHRVASRAELLDAVWQGAFVTEASLNNTISAVRRLLRDDGVRQALVRTARSRGFRFVGNVTELTCETAATPADLESRALPARSSGGQCVASRDPGVGCLPRLFLPAGRRVAQAIV